MTTTNRYHGMAHKRELCNSSKEVSPNPKDVGIEVAGVTNITLTWPRKWQPNAARSALEASWIQFDRNTTSSTLTSYLCSIHYSVINNRADLPLIPCNAMLCGALASFACIRSVDASPFGPRLQNQSGQPSYLHSRPSHEINFKRLLEAAAILYPGFPIENIIVFVQQRSPHQFFSLNSPIFTPDAPVGDTSEL